MEKSNNGGASLKSITCTITEAVEQFWSGALSHAWPGEGGEGGEEKGGREGMGGEGMGGEGMGGEGRGEKGGGRREGGEGR